MEDSIEIEETEEIPKYNLIPENFYDDCEIFITGGSGVIGKVLIEKILRTCHVKKIYILMRMKNGVNFENRLNIEKEEKIFDLLKKTKPNELEKLIAVSGDICLPQLGLTQASKNLMKNVSYVYHIAGTVNFNDPWKTAIITNVKGTYECIQFAQTLAKLKLFMLVSKTYLNPQLELVDNKIFPIADNDWRTCMKIAESNQFTEELGNALLKKLIKGFPNTYTFTKCLAEHVVNDFRHKIPTAIFRHSVVTSSINEPQPGYIDSLNGLMGLTSLVATGLLRTIKVKKGLRLDKSPLDITVKIILLSTIRTVLENDTLQAPLEDIPIYLMTSANINRDTVDRDIELLKESGVWEKYPAEKCIWKPNLILTSNRFYYNIRMLLFQLLPSLLLDLMCPLVGHKAVFLGLQRTAYQAMEEMNFLCFYEYETTGISHMKDLQDIGKDSPLSFDKDMQKCESKAFCETLHTNIQFGVKKYLLNENVTTLFKSKAFYFIFCILDFAVEIMTYLLLGKILLKFGLQYLRHL